MSDDITRREAERALREPLLGSEEVIAYFAQKMQLVTDFADRITWNRSLRYGLSKATTHPMHILNEVDGTTSFAHDLLAIKQLQLTLTALQSSPVTREMENNLKSPIAEIFDDGMDAIGRIYHAADTLHKDPRSPIHRHPALATDKEAFAELYHSLGALKEHAVAAFALMHERTTPPRPSPKMQREHAQKALNAYINPPLWKKAESLGTALAWGDPEKDSGFLFHTIIRSFEGIISPDARSAMDRKAHELEIDVSPDDAIKTLRAFFTQETREMQNLKRAMERGEIKNQDVLQSYATLHDSLCLVQAAVDRALSSEGAVTNHYKQHGAAGAFDPKNLGESKMPGNWQQMEALAGYYRNYLDGFAQTMDAQLQNIDKVQGRSR